MSAIRFEPLAPIYVPAIVEIEKASHGAPWSERAFLNELTHPHSLFRVGLMQRDVVAYGGIWMVVDEAHVTTVTVSPEHRRKGLGEKLVVELLLRAKENGMTCSTLEVRAGNLPAKALYEKLGFSVVATRKRYYPDNHEDALIMWLYELQSWEPPR